MADRITQDWQKLIELIGDRDFVIERVRLVDADIAVEGAFEPPKLADLEGRDLAFLAAFVRSHGSIKQMEKMFGVSYPTIKSRLNQLGEKFDFVEVEIPDERVGILEMVDRGELTVAEALERLKGQPSRDQGGAEG